MRKPSPRAWNLTIVALAVAGAAAIAQQPAPQAPPAGGRQAGAPVARPGGPGVPRVPSLPFPDTPQELDTLGPKIRVVPMAKGLVNPWGIAFLPNGDVLVTEKPGRLRVIRNGTLDPQPVGGVPEVYAVGQGGLLEVLPHPRFAENQFLYLTYSKSRERTAATPAQPAAAAPPAAQPAQAGQRGQTPPREGTTVLARGRFDGKALTDVRELFVADNWNTGNPHYGGKLAFGRDGMLYMTIGERGDRNRAQNTALHGGKLLRLREDGTAAPDNPFAGRDGFKPEIYTYGHRNAQGLAFHPETGVLWSSEHGPQGGDELNTIVAGKNYGWPIATYGREYSGEFINPPYREGVELPVIFWAPSLGLSGMTFYTGDRFPAWKGNVFLGALSGQQIQRVVFTEKGPVGREALLGTLKLRIRDVRQGPDGFLYAAADENPGGILRIEPAAVATSSAGR
jgi:glucose/arabinose dehydrogenase